MTYEYAIKSKGPDGNWTVEAPRYGNVQILADTLRSLALLSNADISDVYRPLARLAANDWVELDPSKFENLNALTVERNEALPERQSHMTIEVEAYERLLSAAMAYAYQLHPQYGSTATWHKEQMGAATPTQGCSITDTPPWAEALLEAAKAEVNAHIHTARSQGLLVDRLQQEHPEHNPHAHRPRPYKAPR